LVYRGKKRALFHSFDSVEPHDDTVGDLADVGGRPEVRYINSAVDVANVQAEFAKDHDGSLFVGIQPRVLSPSDLRDISVLANREYSGAKFYDIESVPNCGRFPYIHVETPGGAYGAAQMGAGEYATLLFYWVLLTAPKDSILLLEEPESLIAPRSQVALANLLKRWTLKQNATVVATTHSPDFCAALPDEAVFAVYRDASHRTKVSCAAAAVSLLRENGYVRPRVLLVLVEDRLAERFLKHALDLVEFDNLLAIVTGKAACILVRPIRVLSPCASMSF